MQKTSDYHHQCVFEADVWQMDNGLTVVHQFLPATPVVVTDVWVRAGAIAEPENWSGMAHFLEHMIFKGTKYIAPGEFDEIIEHSGGMTNAATSHDYAHFFLTTAATYLPDTLPYLAEILLQAEIPDEEFYCERDVVLEEIRYSYDDPDWVGFQALCETIYQCHPYRRPILGDEEILLQHTPNQMRCFHRTHYQPENMTVVMVGGIDKAQAQDLIQECFTNFAPRSECPPLYNEAEPPLIGIRRTEMELPRIEQARLSFGWLGPGVEQIEDAFALDVLSIILASGRSSRLVRELREEKQLVLDITSSFSLQRESSLFTINVWLQTECLPEVEAIIQQRIFDLQHQNISIEELIKAQRVLCNDYIFSTESPGQLAGLYGYYQTIAEAQLAAAYPKEIARCCPKKLKQIASQYLSPERYAITIIKPH